MDGWVGGEIHRTGSIHMVEYYAAMKRSEALTQAAMWMDLEPTMLGERSQTQKDTEWDSMHRKHPEQGSPQRDWVSGARGWWGEGRGVTDCSWVEVLLGG